MKQYTWIGLCLSILITACQPKADSHAGHDHGSHGHPHGDAGHGAHEEHATMSLTLFNDQTELFVEFPLLMLGHVAEFTTHLTNLESYKPYTEGKLTVKLIKGTKGIRNTVKAPARAGIFLPSLQPRESGNYSLVFEVESKYGKEVFTAKNIRVYKDHAEAEQYQEAHNDNETTYLKEQAWKVDFATSLVKNSPFQQVVKTTGELLQTPTMEKKLVAQTSGIVHLKSNQIVIGKEVRKNENIFYISGKGLAEDNVTTRFVSAKNELNNAKADFERAEKLHKDQIISEKEFLNAKAAFENAKVKFHSIQANFKNRSLLLNSPMNGFISEIFVKEGQYVEKGEVIANIANNSKLMLQADLYQKHLKQLPHIKSANFKLPYKDEIYSTAQLNGKLIAYSKNIHKDNFTTPLFFEIDKADLYAGSFVEVYLQTENADKKLHVLKSAILEDQGVKYVFVQTAGESFAKRFVSVGADNGKEVEIISGLQEGERVVSTGAYFVRLASLAGALPAHSHSH
jgi:RND family efflux transporter MFP subunit